ncbi:hypothetical protein [Thalassolituus hydrocarboniclasticus]|uniref:Uncharacterized protein n=1 Tax=Thalassolituus hydrocarboniclasticus TaxID=2742796 RepID=A0ABY6AAG4_9GAMM|nr:hypothetical protein [Thalassolituus hydrocarboniclasticus]UXD87266.1 hypothetical protein HUF19_07400 [Thalassolituus hydrocarboniclasticus]
MNFEEELKKKTGGRAFFYSFQNVSWAKRYEGLREVGFINSDILTLSEVKFKDAEKLLIDVLSTDLCYKNEVMTKLSARELAKEFMALQDKQARFFTNSNVPYSNGENAWSFTPITGATIDTGLMVKVGKQLDSMLWVADVD